MGAGQLKGDELTHRMASASSLDYTCCYWRELLLLAGELHGRLPNMGFLGFKHLSKTALLLGGKH